MTSPWWATFGPCDARVSCGAGKHVVRWTDGRLKAVDHPDAEGELVLAALGGDATPCLDLARVWGQHCDDLAVLSIGPRSAGDTLTFTAPALEEIAAVRSAPTSAMFAGGVSVSSHAVRRLHAPSVPRATGGLATAGVISTSRTGWSGSAPRPRRGPVPRPWRWRPGMGMQADPSRAELVWLLTLGTAFQLRLSGAVAHAWSADGQHAGNRGRAGPALTAALTGRLAPAAAQWLGVDPGQVDASIHDGPGWGEIELARTAGERRLRAKLPVSWLARIWAPGFAVVGGHLVVSVQQVAWPAAQVLALRAPGGKPAPLSIRHDGRRWSVTA
jgi:hypothetical protein